MTYEVKCIEYLVVYAKLLQKVMVYHITQTLACHKIMWIMRRGYGIDCATAAVLQNIITSTWS